jgi:Salt stress response/antifungal
MTLVPTCRNIFYLLFLFLLSCNLRCRAKPILCTGPTYDPVSQFHTNLHQLIAALHGNTPHKLFYNVSFGSKSDQVFGLALCRGDDSEAGCDYCLSVAFAKIYKGCINSKTAVIWFDTCMLRYSDKDFFGLANTSYKYCHLDSLMTEPNANALTTSVTNLLNNLSNVAANSSRLFAVGEVNFAGDSNTKLYGLAECTKDLSADDCYSCLVNNTNALVSRSCNQGRRGARILGESCYLWYNDTRFYNSDQFLNNGNVTESDQFQNNHNVTESVQFINNGNVTEKTDGTANRGN